MATSLLALLDDIATILDDVALLTQAATKKTAGVLGDDLALNAQQVAGVKADRELPVVWAVAKGSLVNKATQADDQAEIDGLFQDQARLFELFQQLMAAAGGEGEKQ